MNNLRRAQEAGGRVVRIVQRDKITGKALAQRVNPGRRAKRETHLSARQFKKLRKRLNREYKNEREQLAAEARTAVDAR